MFTLVFGAPLSMVAETHTNVVAGAPTVRSDRWGFIGRVGIEGRAHRVRLLGMGSRAPHLVLQRSRMHGVLSSRTRWRLVRGSYLGQTERWRWVVGDYALGIADGLLVYAVGGHAEGTWATAWRSDFWRGRLEAAPNLRGAVVRFRSASGRHHVRWFSSLRVPFSRTTDWVARPGHDAPRFVLTPGASRHRLALQREYLTGGAWRLAGQGWWLGAHGYVARRTLRTDIPGLRRRQSIWFPARPRFGGAGLQFGAVQSGETLRGELVASDRAALAWSVRTTHWFGRHELRSETQYFNKYFDNALGRRARERPNDRRVDYVHSGLIWEHSREDWWWRSNIRFNATGNEWLRRGALRRLIVHGEQRVSRVFRGRTFTLWLRLREDLRRADGRRPRSTRLGLDAKILGRPLVRAGWSTGSGRYRRRWVSVGWANRRAFRMTWRLVSRVPDGAAWESWLRVRTRVGRWRFSVEWGVRTPAHHAARLSVAALR